MFVGHGPFPLGVVTSRILPDLRFSVSSLLQKTFYTNKALQSYSSIGTLYKSLQQ
jgi:hypothetical protein